MGRTREESGSGIVGTRRIAWGSCGALRLGGGSEVYFYWVQTHSNPLTVKTYFSITYSGNRI